MNAIILAAGKGTRLNGTSLTPKCLVNIGGSTLLQRQISSLRSCGVDRIIVVLGFQGKRIRRECGQGVTYVENLLYAETSSLYSLWLAKKYLRDGFVVLNSDVLFHPQILGDLLDSPHDDALLLAYSRSLGQPLGEEEMKVKLRGDLVVDISKEMSPLDADGENVGIVKFGPTGAKKLIRYMDKLIAQGLMKDWAPRAFKEFARHHHLHVVSTRDYPWIEIDFPEDYQKAVDKVYPLIEQLTQPQ